MTMNKLTGPSMPNQPSHLPMAAHLVPAAKASEDGADPALAVTWKMGQRK